MPPREYRFRIQDIFNAIEDIELFSSRLTNLDDFKGNKMAFYATLKALEIIGEAAHHIPNEIKEKYNDVPWIILKDFRNKLSHEYFGIDPQIVWGAIKTELPFLKKQIQKILQEIS